MSFVRYRPAAPLDACVDCFWWSKRDHAEPATERMLPCGAAQLIFMLHDMPIVCTYPSPLERPLVWSRGIVHGPQGSYYESGAKPAGCVVGVAFKPGAANVFLGVPMADLAGRHVPIDALWGRCGEELREQLCAAASPPAVFLVLERELAKRLKRPLQIHPAVAHALRRARDGWSPVRVAEVQRAAGYSPKHFIALFRNAVGLTPKHFYRIKRFTTVLQHLADGNTEGLAGLAGAAGYSDQSHLTREFREFAGFTPTQYRPRNAQSILHQQVRNLLDRDPGITIISRYTRTLGGDDDRSPRTLPLSPGP